MKTQITRKNGTDFLKHKNVTYKVRYYTEGDSGLVAVIDCGWTLNSLVNELSAGGAGTPDKGPLFGKYGDEFPMSQVDNFKNGKLVAV